MAFQEICNTAGYFLRRIFKQIVPPMFEPVYFRLWKTALPFRQIMAVEYKILFTPAD